MVLFYPGYEWVYKHFHKFPKTMDALQTIQLLRNLAARTAALIKGASYTNSEGKNIVLIDKDQIARSKREIRDASGIYLREQVSKASSNLNSYLSKGGYIVIPNKAWVDFITLGGRDSKEIISQLAANNRAGILAEGIFIVLGNEMADAYHVKTIEEISSKKGPEPVSEEEPATKKATSKKESTSKPKGSKSKALES